MITGSFNFTKAAEEKSAENLLVVQDKGLAEKYTENWQLHAAHSEVYKGSQGRLKCWSTKVLPGVSDGQSPLKATIGVKIP